MEGMTNAELKIVADALKKANPKYNSMADGELIKLFSKTAKDILPELEAENAKPLIANYGKFAPKFKDFFKEPVEMLAKKVAQKTSPTAVKIVGYIPDTSEFIAYYNGDISRISEDDLIKSELEYDQVLKAIADKKAATAAKTKAAREAKKQAEGKSKK